MSKYNFEDNEDEYGKTRRLDSINEEIKKYHGNENNSYNIKTDNSDIEKKLGDKNSYLNSINSEKIPNRESKIETFDDSTIVLNNNITNQNRNQKYSDIDETVVLDKDFLNNTKKIENKKIENKNIENKKRGQYKLFMSIAIGIGIIVFIAVFVLTFMSTNKSQNNSDDKVVNNTNTENKNTANIVESIENSRIVIKDISTGSSSSIKPDSDTEIFDKNGKKSSLNNILVGDIISVELDENKEKVLKITYPDKYFYIGDKNKSDLYSLEVSENKDKIVCDNKTYKISEYTDIIYKDQHKSISDLTEVDKVILKGYDDTVYYIEILEFHGNINIKNADKLENGNIKIDDNEKISISDNSVIPVTEGSHKILITGSNINDYSAEIFIVSGESFDIDLGDLQGKKCVLIIKANVNDYKLYINDVEVYDTSSPQVIDEGQYTIRIEKEGYEPFNQTLNLSGSSYELKAELKELAVEKVSFVITTYPAGADIYIDNEYIGKSPINTNLSEGDYKFVAKLSGYSDIDRNISIDNNTQSIDFSFQ